MAGNVLALPKKRELLPGSEIAERFGVRQNTVRKWPYTNPEAFNIERTKGRRGSPMQLFDIEEVRAYVRAHPRARKVCKYPDGNGPPPTGPRPVVDAETIAGIVDATAADMAANMVAGIKARSVKTAKPKKAVPLPAKPAAAAARSAPTLIDRLAYLIEGLKSGALTEPQALAALRA